MGESYAKSYLEDRGHRILRTNIYSHWGELDIISEKEGTIHFIKLKHGLVNRGENRMRMCIIENCLHSLAQSNIAL